MRASLTLMSFTRFEEDTVFSISLFIALKVCKALKEAGVEIFSGPRLSQTLTFGPPEVGLCPFFFSFSLHYL